MLHLWDSGNGDGLEVVREPVRRWVRGECIETGEYRYGARVSGDLRGSECWDNCPLAAVAAALESAASVSSCALPWGFYSGV